ncbi:5-oxoprolinase subunit PxpB [Brevibacillus migulae]|uniref:5-oxoprolinase subunit PxpB n=1 Tax=Brevibacillus migulae TaxID=1644114 RepID=UPI00106E6035|nr:5-oxoprolinase subunit PxpB [Brevibacillus migulae]
MTNNKYNRQPDVTCHPLGDAAATIEFARRIDPAAHEQVRALVRHLEECRFPGMIEYVPSFSSVTVFYDPREVKRQWQTDENGEARTAFQLVSEWLMRAVAAPAEAKRQAPRIVEVPVCYGGEYGPDLGYVAESHGLTEKEVIQIHSAAAYTVYMIGFAPGFPYLGGMSERIATPRRSNPRLTIPAGSVGIGGQQTGIYPIETPGGWQVIGRTPVRLFQPEKHPPSLLMAGDVIRFIPITPEEYQAYEEEGQ